MVLGVVTLGFASYLYFSGSNYDKIGYLYMAGSMAVVLSLFRIAYRRYMNDHPNEDNN